MSIYATLHSFAIRRFGENNYHPLLVQGVPAHIQHSGPGWEWLPPPVPYDEDAEDDGPEMLRAVVVVEEGTAKGTPRCGQEYVDPLVIMSGEEWQRLSFDAVMSLIENKMATRYGDAPVIVISDAGKVTKVYKDDLIPPGD